MGNLNIMSSKDYRAGLIARPAHHTNSWFDIIDLERKRKMVALKPKQITIKRG